nr:IMPACT family member in pol 5region [Tanacetum cinerariifolium]
MVTATTSRSNTVSGGTFITISERVTIERDIKKSKFIAIAGHISDERSAQSFLSEVQDSRATHNCWAYKVGNQYRSNDDGEPSGTAGKPIHSAIENSGLDRVMVVVIRHFGGIKLGTGGLVRAYGGVATECLKSAPTRLIKSQVPMGVEVSFDLLGVVYHQLHAHQCVPEGGINRRIDILQEADDDWILPPDSVILHYREHLDGYIIHLS